MNIIKDRIIFLLFLGAVLIIGTPLSPQPVFAESEQPEPVEQTESKENETENMTAADPEISPGLGAHKPTYFLFTWTSFDEDRQKEELKFQISFKQRLYPWRELTGEDTRYKLYFAYTQKSFWQVFDTDHSSPFRETNYNPELFIRTPKYKPDWGVWSIDGGYEHESNGQDVPLSRSWDRLYIKPRLEKGIFFADYKLWYRFEEKKKDDELDTEGDDNPDIKDFYGISELRFGIDFSEHPGAKNNWLFQIQKSVISIMLRYNFEKEKGAVQADYFLPLSNNFKVYFQYWDGYGESLIDYDQRLTKYGFGLALLN